MVIVRVPDAYSLLVEDWATTVDTQVPPASGVPEITPVPRAQVNPGGRFAA